MRIFIALELSQEMKRYLYQIQREIRDSALKGSFTLEDNFHLTLKFIGDTSEEELKKLKDIVDRISNESKPFDLRLNSIGFFSRGDKKIIWISIFENKELSLLVKNMNRALEKVGYLKEDKEYVPHITLGRQIVLKEEFNILKKDIMIEPKKIKVNEISIMESVRIEDKLVYKPLYRKGILS